MINSNVKKNYFWNTIGTALVSFLSLFLMIIATRINGIDQAGIFSFSFASACIINIFALYCGRTYQVTDDNIMISESTYVVTRILTSFIGVFIAVLFALINGYEIGKLFIFISLCCMKCIEAICDVYYGVNQKRDNLYLAGKSMVYRSLVLVVGFLIIDVLTKNLVISCLYLVIITFLFMLLYDRRNANKDFKINYTLKKNEIKILLKTASYTCLFSLIVMVAINIPKYAIDYLSSDSVQAIYGIISMPATFIMLFGQFILQPSLTSLARAYRTNNKTEFVNIVVRISLIIFLSLLIILPVAYYLGIPVLNFIYAVNLDKYKLLLLLVIIGAAFYAVSQILLNSLITLRCTKEQLYLQIVTLILSIGIAVYFVNHQGLSGSVISYFIILVIQFLFYLILFIKEIRKKFDSK